MNRDALNHQREEGEETTTGSGNSTSSSSSSSNELFNAIAALIFKAAFWLAILTLVILCIPGIIAIVIIASWSYFYLTRQKMMRPTEVLLYMGGTGLIGIILWFALDAPQKFRTAFQNLTQKPGKYLTADGFPELILNFSTPFTVGGIILGAAIGLLISVNIYYTYNRFDEIKHIPDHWMHISVFKYRLTPFQRRKRNKTVEAIESGANFILPGEKGKQPGVALGINEDTGEAVYFTTREINRSMVSLGEPGSGKTIGAESEIRANTKLGISSIVINMKADINLARKLANYAYEEDFNFYHFTRGNPYTGKYENAYNPNGRAYFDPFAGLSVAEKIDIGIKFQAYDRASEKYKNDVWATLQTVLVALDKVEKALDALKTTNPKEHDLIVQEIEDGGLEWYNGEFRRCYGALMHPEVLLNHLPAGNSAAADLRRRIHDPEVKGSWGTLRGNFGIILNSEFGKWVGLPQNGEPYIDFHAVADPASDPSIVLFDFNADSEAEVSAGFGKMLTGVLTTMSAHRRSEDGKSQNLIEIFFDEFQAIPLEFVEGLVEKARSSNVGVCLGQQNLDQLRKYNDETAVRSLLVNVGTIVARSGMKGGGSAEYLASLAGTKEVEKYKVDAKRDRVWWKNLIQWDDIRRYYKSSETVRVPNINAEDIINLRIPHPEDGDYYAESMVIRKSAHYNKKTKKTEQRYGGTKVHVVLPRQVLEKLPPVPEHPVHPKTTSIPPSRPAHLRKKQETPTDNILQRTKKPEKAVAKTTTSTKPEPHVQRKVTPPQNPYAQNLTPQRAIPKPTPKKQSPQEKPKGATPPQKTTKKPPRKKPRITQAPAPKPAERPRPQPIQLTVSGAIAESVENRRTTQTTKETPNGD